MLLSFAKLKHMAALFCDVHVNVEMMVPFKDKMIIAILNYCNNISIIIVLIKTVI